MIPGITASGATAAGVTDPNFADVVLLLHMNGADAATTFPDSSLNAFTVTANGNAQVDTAIKKYGSGAALFDGVGDYLTVPDDALFAFGTNDFCVECWAWIDSAGAGTARRILSKAVTSVLPFELRVLSSNSIYAEVSDSFGIGLFNETTVGAAPTDTWIHLAITRSGTDFRAFLDGVQFGATGTSPDPVGSNSTQLHIGSYAGGSSPFKGSIDDVRITNGAARYTSNFTPPAFQFPDA